MPDRGPEGFVSGLLRLGCSPSMSNGIVVFVVVPADGSHAGVPVKTGVAAQELDNWPSTPPHWVHLPAEVQLRQTNARSSPVEGWLMHSRNVVRWGNAKEPAEAWVAHVRSVLADS